ncbi:hypothetical protein AB0J74_17740 [Asanoa sp. NPDC049573]|uniref:hypothetical protein n=1 Tax=Asanoa sp. NPDC049573 TaxID=3155396 RepID=UPI003425379D
MTILDTRLRLDAALTGVANAFRGMTAHPDENNCECHWGSAEELALLKTPDVPLDPDLLRRTWRSDWSDYASILRRILPQFATTLAGGRVMTLEAVGAIGVLFRDSDWQRWPAEQAGAVWEFLAAWWAHTLTDPHPAAPAYEVLPVLAAASGRLEPWLAAWESMPAGVADRHLADTLVEWDDRLMADELPWDTWNAVQDDAALRRELTDWLLRHAPDRLRHVDGSERLSHRVRLLGLPEEARWRDPHWAS